MDGDVVVETAECGEVVGVVVSVVVPEFDVVGLEPVAAVAAGDATAAIAPGDELAYCRWDRFGVAVRDTLNEKLCRTSGPGGRAGA